MQLHTRTPYDDLVSACAEFADRAERAGYGELVACSNPLHCADSQLLHHVRGELPGDLGVFARLFLFGAGAPTSEAERALGPDVLEAFVTLGVLSRRNGIVSSAGLDLRRIAGLWYLHESSSANPSVYFGDDSVALMWRASPRPGDHILDLCTGPGIQLLHTVRTGASGVGVDVNAFALGIAEINARLNGLHETVRFLNADIAAPEVAREGPFDLVLANPPLLPFAEDAGYPFVGHGGADGMCVTWPLLDSLPGLLAEQGRAQIIGTTLTDGFALCVEDRLQQWARAAQMDVVVTVPSQSPLHRGSPVFESLVATAHAASGAALDELRDDFEASNTRLGGTHLAGFFLHITAGSGGVRVIDSSRPDSATFFFV